MVTIPTVFRNSNYEDVPYDGSPVTWRISVYGLLLKNASALLVHHKDEKLFDIPGGGVELDEDIQQALAREGLEEAGWDLTPTRLLFTMNDWFYHMNDKKFYRTLQFYYEAVGKKIADPTDSRIVFADLVPLDELEKYQLYPNVERSLKEVSKQ